MENSGDPKGPITRASMSMDSTSLETLRLSLGNVGIMNDTMASTSQAQAHGDKVSSSSLPLNGSLTGVLPCPGSSNRGNILDSSKIGSLGPYFNLMNLNGDDHQQYYGFAESLLEKTLNPANGFGARKYLYNLASQKQKDSMLGPFSNGNPGLPSHPEGNLWGNNGFSNWTQHRINGIESRGGNGIIAMAMTAGGSKYLQDLLLLKDPGIEKLIFEGVIEYILQLMTNQHGRYLFQKLIELEEANMSRMIMVKLTFFPGDIFNASVDRYGSNSIKKLIKVLEKSPLVTEVVKVLCSKFWELMVHPTGQYVILQCLDVVDSQKNDLLYVEAINNCLRLATHEQGCASLNNFIVRIKGPRRDQLLNLICDHVVYLSQDPAGNFVVQCVLGLQNSVITDKICSKLKGYYVKLSLQKGGSHVVEKCLRSSGMDHVVHEFLRSNQLYQVAKDGYGNYVLQTALKETEKTGSPLHRGLVVKLQQHRNSLQHGYGRNILRLMTATVQVN